MGDTEDHQNDEAEDTGDTGEESQADDATEDDADTSTNTDADDADDESGDDSDAEDGDSDDSEGNSDDSGSDTAGDDDGDADDTDDGEEPELRKPAKGASNKEWATWRAQEKAKKDKSGDSDDKDGDDTGGEDADGKDDESEVAKEVAKQMEPFHKQQKEQEVNTEIADFLVKNPDFKQFETKVRRFANHKNRSGVPVTAIFYEVAGPKLMAMGAKRGKAADAKANKTKGAGGQNAGKQGGESYKDMNLNDFGKELEKAKLG